MASKAKSAAKLSVDQKEEIIKILQDRFEKNPGRHKNIQWKDVLKKLEASDSKLLSLSEMERTGGEPDVVEFDRAAGEFIFCDCAAESPSGRRSLCYDGEALKSRKENKPRGSAMEAAREMGIELMDEAEYRRLQKLGNFDLKTSSWLKTPAEIRNLGGAVFGDRRYDTVFIYHNGAESYYAARGFRGILRF